MRTLLLGLISLVIFSHTSLADYHVGNLAVTGVGSTSNSLSAGNVGIGSTNPGQALDVNGTVNISGDVLSRGINITGETPSTTSVVNGEMGNPNILLVGTNGGNTSISTTGVGGDAPVLVISGGKGGEAPLANTASTGGYGGDILFTAGDGGAATASGTNLSGTGGILELSGGDAGVASGGSGNTQGSPGDVYLHGGKSSSVSGNVIMNLNKDYTRTGLVGIGTWNPNSTSLIHTYINSNNLFRVVMQNASNGTASQGRFTLTNDKGIGVDDLDLIDYSSGNTASLFGVTLADYKLIYANGSSNNGLIIGNSTAKPIIFGVNNAEKMRMDGTGNVGIGTTITDGRVTIGGTCQAHTGDTACIGVTTIGAACLGYCSGGLGGNCTACTCC